MIVRQRTPKEPYRTFTTEDGETISYYGPMVEIVPGVMGPSRIVSTWALPNPRPRKATKP